MWKPGAKLIMSSSPELGVGVVLAVEGRFIDVHFPDSDASMRLTPQAANIVPVVLAAGDAVRLTDGSIATIRGVTAGVALLSNGRRARLGELWPHIPVQTPVDRLRSSVVDPLLDVLNRLDGQRLLNYRRRGDVASLVGGRVELFAHQIDTAARAIRSEPVRWLLADEVGLGKTVVACMVISALVRMGRIDKVVIVVPDTLTVQWLGELYRKFHQVFVHIDDERLIDVRTDFGRDANPFGVYPLAIVSSELLASEPALLAQLERDPPQLLVVDEAHQVFNEKIGDVLLPVAATTQHALMLTATPFQLGEVGFRQLATSLALPTEQHGDTFHVHNVSACTRTELVALAARRPEAVPIERPGDLGGNDERVAWLLEALASWGEHEKLLLFVNSAAAAKKLSDTLTRKTGKRVFTFHEEMGTKQRDIELAQFRMSTSRILVSSGAGSEGRNFQFCDRMVHVELPDDPVVLEQRIGRMDRIGRDADIPIYYFEYAASPLAALYAAVGLFADASVGSSPAMAYLRQAIAAADDLGQQWRDIAQQTRERLVTDAVAWSFPDSHQRANAEAVLAEIPDDLDEMLKRFCLDAAENIGLDVVEKDGGVYYFEYGSAVEVDAVPGVPEGSRFLGTFDRKLAIANEALDFFANGHPLIEGLVAELEDSKRGRVGALRLPRRQSPNLHGLYLLILEGRDQLATPRIVPLMHATGVDFDTLDAAAEAAALYESFDLGIELDEGRVKALMGRVANQPMLTQLDASKVAQAILVAVMD